RSNSGESGAEDILRHDIWLPCEELRLAVFVIDPDSNAHPFVRFRIERRSRELSNTLRTNHPPRPFQPARTHRPSEPLSAGIKSVDYSEARRIFESNF